MPCRADDVQQICGFFQRLSQNLVSFWDYFWALLFFSTTYSRSQEQASLVLTCHWDALYLSSVHAVGICPRWGKAEVERDRSCLTCLGAPWLTDYRVYRWSFCFSQIVTVPSGNLRGNLKQHEDILRSSLVCLSEMYYILSSCTK